MASNPVARRHGGRAFIYHRGEPVHDAPLTAPPPGEPDVHAVAWSADGCLHEGPLALPDALLDGLPSGLLVIDRAFRIQRVNRYTASWLKREPAEMLGQRCHELVHRRETPCPDCPCAVSFRTGERATAVHTGLDADGSTTHAELVSLPIRDASGEVVMALEASRDVSERVRHAEQVAEAVFELQESQEELRRRNEELELLNGLLLRAGAAQGLDAVLAGLLAGALQAVEGRASAAILLCDESGRRLELAASQGLDGAFTACPASIRLGACACGQAALDGVVRVSPQCTEAGGAAQPDAGEQARIAIPLSSGGRVLGVLVIHLPPGQRLPAGRERLFELLGRQMGIAVENAQLYQRTDAQLHRKVGELTVALEVVERERARALASERAKEEFVSMVAHDLRSPLSVIHADANELGRACQEPRCLSSRESIRRAVRRASAMLTEVVDSARLEAGGLELERAPLDLAALVRDLVAGAFAAGQRDRIRLSLAPDAPPVLGDRPWLERAAVNVIGNALKFAPDDDAVQVRVTAAEGAVRLEVEDRGPGIPPAELPHLFGRYFRASNVRRVSGTGLGLYITRLVVEALGGRASARSEPGRGTTITLALPALAAPPAAARGTDRPRSP